MWVTPRMTVGAPEVPRDLDRRRDVRDGVPTAGFPGGLRLRSVASSGHGGGEDPLANRGTPVMRVALVNAPLKSAVCDYGVGHQMPLGLLMVGGPLRGPLRRHADRRGARTTCPTPRSPAAWSPSAPTWR